MRAVYWLTVGLLTLTPTSLPAADPCEGFTWNVAHELRLFAGPARQLTAGKDAASAPRIAIGQLYQVALAPQSEVHFLTPPEHPHGGDDTLSGVLRVRIPQAGLYRVSLSEGDWIDLVHDGAPITSQDHQGGAGCSAPHKVVQFQLPADEILVQLSGAKTATVRVTFTPAPQSSAPAQ
jgi:hypothetical protein